MKLFFRKYGSGPPLVILHGLYGSSDNWVHIAREVQDYYTVYLPDMRNHGRSPWSDQHSYGEMSNDIAEFINDQHLSSVFIAGHSMGGKTAIRFAVDNPEKVSGLFVGDITPFSFTPGTAVDDHHRERLKIMTDTDPSRFKNREEIEQYLSSIAGEKATRMVFSKNITIENGKLRWRINAASLAKNVDSLLEGIPRPPEGKSTRGSYPVIFLKGEDSQYLPESDFDEIKIIFPQAQIRIAAGSGHWIHTDRPDAVVQALKDLLVLSTGKRSN